ncbi:MAG: S8 family peptidase [Pseudomonadota bacterium]
MAIITEDLVRAILLGGRGGPRLLNESAVQIDVWARFAQIGSGTVDLLLTPMETTPAARVAQTLYRALAELPAVAPRDIAPLEGAVAARVSLDDFIGQILPLTGLNIAARFEELVTLVLAARAQDIAADALADDALTAADLFGYARLYGHELSPDLRATLLAALLRVAQLIDDGKEGDDGSPRPILDIPLRRHGEVLRGIRLDPDLFRGRPGRFDEVLVWRVAQNRQVYAMGVSVETIKADAAQRVFDVDCRTLTWAVVDSGIDAAHPAFRDHDAGNFATRVDKAYDFSSLRKIASFDSLLGAGELDLTLAEIETKLLVSNSEARAWLDELRADAQAGRPYDWERLSRLIEVPVGDLPAAAVGQPNGHGTHVAGVLAGDWREDEKTVYHGVCPNIRLYDLRVLGSTNGDTEFGVIAALEFVRWLNRRNRFVTVHGANLSIGLVHDMANFACGRTPVCMACEATVASGVTVVSAAGNWGAQTYRTAKGDYSGYAQVSIADPGNAASVITVGATHRERPHEYGVSFFSSRGPTGDGRLKPDVVAPGERIDGPLPNLGFGRLDGTSMAAPHVSGVAALLMARYPEMIGDPARVKSVIMNTATDLGRERYFQGAGLVDALRALQAV